MVEPFSLVVHWMSEAFQTLFLEFIYLNWEYRKWFEILDISNRTVPNTLDSHSLTRPLAHKPNTNVTVFKIHFSPNGYFQLWHHHQCESYAGRKKGKIHHITKCAQGKYRRSFSFSIFFRFKMPWNYWNIFFFLSLCVRLCFFHTNFLLCANKSFMNFIRKTFSFWFD